MSLGSEATALVVGQTQSSVAELLLEHAVLLDEVFDRLSLVPVDSAGEGLSGSSGSPPGCCAPISFTLRRLTY